MKLFEFKQGIPRNQLPQIHVVDIDGVYDYQEGLIELKKMKPVQTERIESEYKDAVKKVKNKKAKQILLDKNFRIVNGHHRYDAYKHLGYEEAPAVIVNASLEELMKEFSHTAEDAGGGAGGGAGGAASGSGSGASAGGDGGSTGSSGDGGSADSGDTGSSDSAPTSDAAVSNVARGFFFGTMRPSKNSKKKKKKKKSKNYDFGGSIYASLDFTSKIGKIVNEVLSGMEPNFDFEWQEAKRYPEFAKLGKEKWIQLAKTGKLVKITSANDINNTDAGSPESFYDLEKDKQKRALQQVARGSIEPPIVAVYSDGHKELIAGNTRLTISMLRRGSAVVWQFNVPDNVTESSQAWNKYELHAFTSSNSYADTDIKSIQELKQKVEVLLQKGFPAEDIKVIIDHKFAKMPEYGITNEVAEGTRCWKGYKKKGMKTMFGKRVPNCVKNEDVTKGNFGGVIYPRLPHEEVLDAISSWEYGDTPIELSNGYVINAREEGYNDDDNAWVLLDPQGKMVDHGEGSIEDVMQDFTPKAIDENFADGKVKGKSRPGRVKRSGASCKGSVSSLRAKAKKYSGEKGKMYHWCANMKGGKKKK